MDQIFKLFKLLLILLNISEDNVGNKLWNQYWSKLSVWRFLSLTWHTVIIGVREQNLQNIDVIWQEKGC